MNLPAGRRVRARSKSSAVAGWERAGQAVQHPAGAEPWHGVGQQWDPRAHCMGWLLSPPPLLLPRGIHPALGPAGIAALGVTACPRHNTHHPGSASGQPVTDLFTLYKTPSSSMPSRWMEKRGDFSSAGRYGAASLGRQKKVRGCLHTPTLHPVTPRHGTMPQHPSQPLHSLACPAAGHLEGY